MKICNLNPFPTGRIWCFLQLGRGLKRLPLGISKLLEIFQWNMFVSNLLSLYRFCEPETRQYVIYDVSPSFSKSTCIINLDRFCNHVTLFIRHLNVWKFFLWMYFYKKWPACKVRQKIFFIELHTYIRLKYTSQTLAQKHAHACACVHKHANSKKNVIFVKYII